LWNCPLNKAIQGGNSITLIHPSSTTDSGLGCTRYTRLTFYPLKDRQGNVDAVLEWRRDVSAERDLETQVLRHRHQLLALSRVSSAVSGLRDLDAILNVALDTVLEIIHGTIGGILLLDPRTQKLSYRVQRGLSAKFVGEMQLGVGEGIAGKVAQTGEPIVVKDVSLDPRTARLELVSAEGLKGFVSVPLRTKDGVVGVMNIASHLPGQFTTEDMHLLSLVGDQLGTAIEQARLYEQLSGATERYHILLQHVLTAQEEERKRIARELHDETSQMLTGLALNLQAIIERAEMADIKDAKIKEGLKKAHSLAVQTGVEVTKLINALRPTLLDSLGLAPAIQRYIETWLQPIGINASLRTQGGDRLPSEIEVALFRITQEAINNIIKHSEARNAMIDLECDADKCKLRIEDDGKGFDVGEIKSIDKYGRGVGIFSMKERVALVGGSCAVESAPGEGTKIVVEVPLIGRAKDAKDQSAGG
jgi:signal transduction histidine kinase